MFLFLLFDDILSYERGYTAVKITKARLGQYHSFSCRRSCKDLKEEMGDGEVVGRDSLIESQSDNERTAIVGDDFGMYEY